MRRINESHPDMPEQKAALGSDIDLEKYDAGASVHAYVPDLSALPKRDKDRMVTAGVDVESSTRSGTFIHKDANVIHSHSGQAGLSILPIREALENHDGVKEYYWNLLPRDMDKYCAQVAANLHDGYFIRIHPGCQAIYPVQTCLYLEKNGFSQNIHNIVVVEEGAKLHIINGCVTASHTTRGLHIGVSEYYVKANATLSFTMIHHWGENMQVRSRSAGIVESGGLFLNNYISLKPVKSLQLYPVVYLSGKNATARSNSILVGSSGADMDVGSKIILREAGTRAEIISRVITNGGRIVSRGNLTGEVSGVKGHLECKGLIMNGGSIKAIPELEGNARDVEMTHEAAIGKIAQNEILYLMSRGLSENEATAAIIRGFLNVDITGLPDPLKAEIDRAVKQI